MRRLELTEIARADLKSIRRYSTRTWGQDQTSRYMGAIRDTLKDVVRGTVVTRDRDDLRPGLQMATCGRHCIFFEADQTVISWSTWQVGDGPAIRLLQARENAPHGLVMIVASLRRAKAFLREKVLLGADSEEEATIDHPKFRRCITSRPR